jgi:hypothetical protein
VRLGVLIEAFTCPGYPSFEICDHIVTGIQIRADGIHDAAYRRIKNLRKTAVAATIWN